MNQEIEVSVKSPSELSPMNTREHALIATYDFLKHMSGLSLVTMGGMIGLAQGAGTKVTSDLLFPVGIVGFSGFLSLTIMAGVAGTQILQRVHKSSNGFAFAIIMLVLIAFTVGVSSFVSALFDVVEASAAAER